MTCEGCRQDWVFPSSLGCPHCGASVVLLPANEVETLDPNALRRAANSTDDDEGEEPDLWAKRAIYFGMSLGGLLMIEAFFPSLGLAGLLEAIELPKPLFMVTRAFFFLVGAWAITKGMISRANWTSGYRFYRNYRVKPHRR